MAKLKITELKVTGSELFEDSETFLNDLGNDELENTMGGLVIYPWKTSLTYPGPKPTPPIWKPTIETWPYTPVIL